MSLNKDSAHGERENPDIAYLSIEFPPSSYGAGIHAYELSRNLAKLGYNVAVITSSSNVDSIRRENNLRIHILRKSFKIPVVDSLFFGRRATNILHKMSPNVVVAHQIQSSLISVPVDALYILKVNVTMRGTLDAYRVLGVTPIRALKALYFSLISTIEMRIYERADFLIAVSEAIRRELVKLYGVERRKIEVIHVGVDIDKYTPVLRANQRLVKSVKKGLDLRDGEQVILYIGRLVPQKGVEFLVEALPQILKENKNVKLLIVGKATYEAYDRYLNKLIRRKQLEEHVIFLSYVPHDKTPLLYAIADVFVLPSIYEPFPNALLEAMAMQTPIIATKVGGVPEIVRHGENGLLVCPMDGNALADAVNCILMNTDMAQKLAINARKTVIQNSSWPDIALKTSQTIKRHLE